MNNCLRKIKRLEKLFSDNFYNGSGKTAFNIEEGRIPIMVSAPHAINQFRDGKVKYADMYTGGIAKYLHEKTGCHVIYSCMYTESDPNYDEWHNLTGNIHNSYSSSGRSYYISDDGKAINKQYDKDFFVKAYTVNG